MENHTNHVLRLPNYIQPKWLKCLRAYLSKSERFNNIFSDGVSRLNIQNGNKHAFRILSSAQTAYHNSIFGGIKIHTYAVFLKRALPGFQ